MKPCVVVTAVCLAVLPLVSFAQEARPHHIHPFYRAVALFKHENPTDEQVLAELERALVHQADAATPPDQKLLRYVEVAREVRRCPDALWGRYVEQGVKPVVVTDTTLKRRRKLQLLFSLEPDRIANDGMIWLAHRLTSLTVDGKSADLVVSRYHRIVGDLRTGHGCGFQFPLELGPGPHKMNAVWTVEVLGAVRDRREAEKTPAIHTFEVSHEWTIEVAQNLAPSVIPITDPALRDAVRAAVRFKSATLSTMNNNGKIVPIAMCEFAVGDVPIPICYGVEFRSGQKQWHAHHSGLWARPGGLSDFQKTTVIVHAEGLKVGDVVDVALTPNAEMADWGVFVDEMWAEEIVFPNVKLIEGF
jgi:hypothetical protein